MLIAGQIFKILPCSASLDLQIFAILETSNAHISGMGRPINFVFYSMVGFVGMADRMVLLPVAQNRRWMPAAILEISSDDFCGTGHRLNFVFDSRCLLSVTSESHHL